jgi:hypothetical protein
MVHQGLEATLAPFAQPEKPQVFPMPATSFIKSGPHIIMLQAINRRRRRGRRTFRSTADGILIPVLIDFFATI